MPFWTALPPHSAPACVLDAQKRFYETMNANPLRGLYSLSVEATEAIAKVRAQISQLIGGNRPEEVVFTRNTSESPEHHRPLVRPGCALPGRRGGHHHHGASLQPHPLAAGMPPGGRQARVPLPHQDGRAHRRRDCSKDWPQDQDCGHHNGLERAGRARAGGKTRASGARAGRLPGGRRGAGRPPHACDTCRRWERTSWRSRPTRRLAPWAWACCGVAMSS